MSRIVMIFGKTFNVVLERIKARRGQNTRLAHAAAQDLAPAVGNLDERLAGHQHRSDGRPQALGEANRDRLKGRAQVGYGPP